MKHEPFIQIESILCDIPNGSLVLEQHTDDHQGSNLFTEQFESQTSGKGKLEIYPVFPGILLSLDWFLADQVSFRHGANRHILEITHCRFGRIGWNFKSGTSVYLGSGDLSLHSTDCCADSVYDISAWLLRRDQYFYQSERTFFAHASDFTGHNAGSGPSISMVLSAGDPGRSSVRAGY